MGKKHQGQNHEGSASTSPYGLSRLAPATALVDVAQEISEADMMIAQTTSSKLRLIAHQIRRLQEDARTILEEAKQDVDLHRAKCSFSRRIGRTYHLYEKTGGDLYWSMLAPDEWSPEPDVCRGAYRLEADQSWTPMDSEDGRSEEPFSAEEIILQLTRGT